MTSKIALTICGKINTFKKKLKLKPSKYSGLPVIDASAPNNCKYKITEHKIPTPEHILKSLYCLFLNNSYKNIQAKEKAPTIAITLVFAVKKINIE